MFREPSRRALDAFRSLAASTAHPGGDGGGGGGSASRFSEQVAWVNLWLSSLPLDGEAQVRWRWRCDTPLNARPAIATVSPCNDKPQPTRALLRPNATLPTCCYRAQGFFASVPRAIAARLQACSCIPTQAGGWVTPRQAMVCASPTVARLLQSASKLLRDHVRRLAGSNAPHEDAARGGSGGRSPRGDAAVGGGNAVSALEVLEAEMEELLGLQPVHEGLTSVAGSAALRALLGVQEFHALRLLELAQVR